MGQPRPLFHFIFGLFKQTSSQFLQQIYVKKCPSSIRCRDSNPQPSERESLPFTTRPELPPKHQESCTKFLRYFTNREVNKNYLKRKEVCFFLFALDKVKMNWPWNIN